LGRITDAREAEKLFDRKSDQPTNLQKVWVFKDNIFKQVYP